tara:strand:- start:97 stop:666 length:570 start_codon:yes stop_codon:yes gene_type:complete
MRVETGTNVKVHYKGTLEDGTEFDNSRTRGHTLDFEVGSPRIIRGFTDALFGMTEGDSKTITLQPEEAYGPVDPEGVRPVPKDAFGEDFVFEAGLMVQGNGPRGPFVAKIDSVEEDIVNLDFNHPLAGQVLNFEIELVSIEGATTDAAPVNANWSASMKKAELLKLAKEQGLPVNTKSTKAQIIDALSV